MFREQEVRANDPGPLIFERGMALEVDEELGFPLVEPLGGPGWLFTFETMSVEEVGGAIELEEETAEALELIGEVRTQRERFRRYAPILVEKQSAGRQLFTDEAGPGRWIRGSEL
jgi:hypothetical protein